jgi:hypothetical protein
VSRAGGVIDGGGKKTIDKASPFRFEQKTRIWELPRTRAGETMVDVLESGKDTGGGCLDMHESSQVDEGQRAIRFSRSRHTSSHPSACSHKRSLADTDHGRR